MRCGVGHRRGSDLALLCLWRRPAATAPIKPLAWEPPYVMGAALKKTDQKKKKEKKMWYIHNTYTGILFSHENKIMPFAAMWI